MDANKTINKVKQTVSIIEDTDWNEVARDNFNYNDLADAIDMYELAENIESSDIAYNIDMSDLACHISTADVASELDMDEVIEGCGITINSLAEQVAERIADREGMQHLVSEELDAQGVTGVTTDAVESMIHAAIQQFGDSLEVMVSAKLNINK